MAKDKKTETEQPKPVMPTLYNNLVPLMTDVHKDLHMINGQNFSFAAKVNAVPIVIQELPMIIKHYPVVFPADTPGVMLAVLGIRSEQNLFVDDKGSWAADTYIPAYIRRYPFFVARQNEESEPVICFDDTSDFLGEKGDQALFDKGEATDTLKNIVEFTRTFQQHLEASNDYCRAIDEAGLLEEKEISFNAGDEVKANVNGFKALEREKFDAIEADVLKDWMTKGWVDASVLHLASGGNFDRLWSMDRKRNA
ncbi:SapC family protein [Paremcibacter congregatus]|uniref:SapC family protein n=1 Tax=Paremcibacter congregatus TaxID=2043170 RepID=UPI0030EE801C|tara:strand:+ start:3796 stop:4554 length:759 start_codon:yes stop_codon:yes gene_type:complete